MKNNKMVSKDIVNEVYKNFILVDKDIPLIKDDTGYWLNEWNPSNVEELIKKILDEYDEVINHEI